jgi:hypothetical protein
MVRDRMNDDIISQMVDETLHSANSPMKKKAKKELSRYFDKKVKMKRLSKGLLNSLQIFCDEHHIPFAEGEYNKDGKFFQFNIADKRVDFPLGWEYFFEEVFDKRISYYFTIEKSDHTELLEIFSDLHSRRIKRVYCFKEKNKFLMVYLNQFQLRYKNFFEDVIFHESSVSELKKAS